MRLPFFNGSKHSRRDQIIAVDLGTRTTKAVHVQRNGGDFILSGFALLETPITDKNFSVVLLTEHLKAVHTALAAKPRGVLLTLGANEAVVRNVDMPLMPVSEMRTVLKMNSKNYLQQDLSNYLLDCHFFAPTGEPASKRGSTPVGSRKQKVLVAAAKKQLVDDFVASTRGANLSAEHIFPGVLGPMNAFEMAHPNAFKTGIVALVDIGASNSSICILQNGELMLNRAVSVGGNRLTSSIAAGIDVSYPEAEGLKLAMTEDVQTALGAILMSLGKELRASIEFFEHEHDKVVTHVYISGGSSLSPFIVQTLKNELLVDCQTWNPLGFLQLSLPPHRAAELDQVGPQLAVAIGAAMAAF